MSNILIENDSFKVKIVDFGFACESKCQLKLYCGTPSYMAPEILEDKYYDGCAVDVWSLGVVLYKLLTGMYAFGCKNFEICLRD